MLLLTHNSNYLTYHAYPTTILSIINVTSTIKNRPSLFYINKMHVKS